MPRYLKWLLAVSAIAFAFGFKLWLDLLTGLPLNSFTIVGAFSGSLAISGLGAVLPGISVLVFRLFNRPHRFSLIFWGTCMGILAFLMWLGQQDKFIKQAELTCNFTQKQSPTYRQLGLTEDKLASFCSCSAYAIYKVLTISEAQYMFVNKIAPPSLQEKRILVSAQCFRQVFGQ